MSGLAYTVAVCVVGLVCGASGFVHLVRHGRLREHLAQQGMFAARMIALVALATTAVELSIGVLTALMVVGVVDGAMLAGGAMAVAFFLFVGFAVYLDVVRRRAGDASVPCGCGIGDSSIASESVWRAVALAAVALVALVGLLWQEPDLDLVRGDPMFVVLVLAASVTMSNVVIWLPIAFQEDRLLEEAIT